MHTSAGIGDSCYQEPSPLRIARRSALPLSLEKETEEESVWDSLAVAASNGTWPQGRIQDGYQQAITRERRSDIAAKIEKASLVTLEMLRICG